MTRPHFPAVDPDTKLPSAAVQAAWANITSIASKVEKPGTGKNSLTGWYHADGYGVSTTNTAAQNDAAFAAMIAAIPRTGATIYIPEGLYRFNTITTALSVHIRGAGASVNTHLRFGDPLWATQTSTLGGTVLISEKTSAGGAINVPATANGDNTTLTDLCIVGPGSGTSTGLILGGSGGGYPVRVRLRNVTIGNFSVGFLGSNENGQFDSLFIIGCEYGFTTMWPFNGNTINALNVEYCDEIAVRLVDSASNVFTGGVLQANYGAKTISLETTSLADTTHNVFNGMYFENFGPTPTPSVPYEEISVGVVGPRPCTANEFNSPQLSSGIYTISGANTSPIIRFGTNAHQNTLRAYQRCYRVNVEGVASHNLFHGAFDFYGLYDTSTQQLTNRVDDTGTRIFKTAGYMQLPAISTPLLPSAGAPMQAGTMLYDSQAKAIVVTDGTSWRTTNGLLTATLPDTATDKPTAALAQTFQRRMASTSLTLPTGRPILTAVYLPAGTVVTSISFGTTGTALAGGSHGWAALYTPALALMAQSTNDTSITWAANTLKTFTLTAPQTITVTGWHYLALMVVASTMPTIAAAAAGFSFMNEAPSLGGGSSSTGQTTTAPATIAITNGFLNTLAYGYVS